jgi:hypothetical protein
LSVHVSAQLRAYDLSIEQLKTKEIMIQGNAAIEAGCDAVAAEIAIHALIKKAIQASYQLLFCPSKAKSHYLLSYR